MLTQPNQANLALVQAGAGTFYLEAPFRGTAVAPLGTLQVQGTPPGGLPDKVHFGALFAKHVVVEPDWTITHVVLP